MNYGCIGEKLAHSFSKEIHNRLFDYEYILTGIGNPLTIKSPKVQAFLEFFYEFCHEYDIPLEMFE